MASASELLRFRYCTALGLSSACCRCLPDLFSYSTVISTCGAADEWQLALSLYQDLMQDTGVVSSVNCAIMEVCRSWRWVLISLGATTAQRGGVQRHYGCHGKREQMARRFGLEHCIVVEC